MGIGEVLPAVTTAADVIALIDRVEAAAVREEMRIDPEADLNAVPAGRALAALSRRRLPLARMLSEVGRVTEAVEAQLRSSIEVISTDGGPQIPCGRQARELAAVGIDPERLATVEKDLTARMADLERGLKRALEPLHRRMVTEATRAGSIHREAGKIRGPGGARQADFVASRFLDKRRPRYPDGADRLAEDLDEAVQRLVSLVPDDAAASLRATVHQIANEVGACVGQIGAFGTSSAAGDVRSGSARRRVELWCAEAEVVANLLAAASQRAQDVDALVRFHTLGIWKHPWRIYEVWVLCWTIGHLLDLGATVAVDPDRVDAEGVWRVNFSADSKPVCTARLGGADLPVYYQLFQEGSENAMPDIAVQVAGEGFALVTDPKRYARPRWKEFRSVADRYGDAFTPHVSAVVSYRGATREQEDLDAPEGQRRMVLTDVAPGSRTIRILGAAFDAALRSMLGADIVPLRCRMALLDCSGSTRGHRAAMFADLRRILVPGVDDHPRSAIVPVIDVPQSPVAWSDLGAAEAAWAELGGGDGLDEALGDLRARLADERVDLTVLTDPDGLATCSVAQLTAPGWTTEVLLYGEGDVAPAVAEIVDRRT